MNKHTNEIETIIGDNVIMNVISAEMEQIPLIHFVNEDYLKLLNSTEADWFRVLHNFDWQEYRSYGAMYYDALYEFNIRESPKRQDRNERFEDVENKEEAIKRLLFSRSTMMEKKSKQREGSIIYQGKEIEMKPPKVSPDSISPGVVPVRMGGKKPKCFFALFKSFLGASLMGFPAEPESVYLLLTSNPSFARVCGFVPKNKRDEYCYLYVPSLRKLEQFDQVMRESDLWSKIKLAEVAHNLESGIIKIEKELVGDTTHYHAYSSFETVKYKDANGKKQRKSQSRLTKKCNCKDKENCTHEWELSDDGAGTIVKSKTKMYWGHKASVVGFPRQGIPLDAAAVSDASTFDGETFYPHVEKVLRELPEIRTHIDTVIYDSACDDKDLKKKFDDKLGLKLKASLNPRRSKEVTENLPRGIKKITPYGNVICIGGHEMDYKGMRYENEKFIYQAPTDEESGIVVCLSCPYREQCCCNALNGRIINISFDLLPHINTEDPPMAKRFKAIMSRRPSVERMIKRLKCDLGDSRLTKRSNESFQAYLDKTMIAFHLLLRG